MSPENQGVFRLLKEETHAAIIKEDWTTVGSLVVASFRARPAHD